MSYQKTSPRKPQDVYYLRLRLDQFHQSACRLFPATFGVEATRNHPSRDRLPSAFRGALAFCMQMPLQFGIKLRYKIASPVLLLRLVPMHCILDLL